MARRPSNSGNKCDGIKKKTSGESGETIFAEHCFVATYTWARASWDTSNRSTQLAGKTGSVRVLTLPVVSGGCATVKGCRWNRRLIAPKQPSRARSAESIKVTNRHKIEFPRKLLTFNSARSPRSSHNSRTATDQITLTDNSY